MGQRSLPLDDNHIRLFSFECVNDRGFQLTAAELRRIGIQRNTIASSLHESGLARTDHHGIQTEFI
jgi:hypothetical protein